MSETTTELVATLRRLDEALSPAPWEADLIAPALSAFAEGGHVVNVDAVAELRNRLPDIVAALQGIWRCGRGHLVEIEADTPPYDMGTCPVCAQLEAVIAPAAALLEESELIFLSCNDPNDEDTPWPPTIVALRDVLRTVRGEGR